MLLTEDIRARVIRVTMDVLSLDGPPPSLDARIVEDLGADSIDQFSLVSALEEEFGGSIGEDEMSALETLGDIVTFIEQADESER